MKAAVWSSVLAAYLCCGCSLPGSRQEPTIASLGKRPPTLQDKPIQAHERLAITAYSAFLETGDSSAARPLAMRRIADLKLEAEPVPGSPAASTRASDSIRLYRELLENYPERADNDMVLYQLARAYEQNDQPDESLATLARLVDSHPESRYSQEAYFRRGEILFVRK